MSQSSADLQAFAREARRALLDSGLVPPRAGEAVVVFFDTAPWEAFETDASKLLDANERARAARFRFDPDRRSYVLAHALWRVVLSVCLEREPGEVPLRFLPSGQPQLPGSSLSTSLSHSGSEVLIAAGAARMLGVDLERWPPKASMDGLLPSICTPAEACTLQALPPAQRERALLQLWTRKEALLKAFGVGLAQAPAAFGVTPCEPVVPPSNQGEPPCRVVDLALPVGRVGALAAPLEVVRYRLHAPAATGTGAGVSSTQAVGPSTPVEMDKV